MSNNLLNQQPTNNIAIKIPSPILSPNDINYLANQTDWFPNSTISCSIGGNDKLKTRIDKIKREKARRDSINCYLRERKKISDGGTTCIYKCPSVKGRVESNSIGPGFSCPTMMNVLRRE